MRRSRMIFRTLSDRTTARIVTTCRLCWELGGNTLVLPNVLESKRRAGILPLDDANLAERALSHDPQQPEVIKVDWTRTPQVSDTKKFLGGGLKN